MARREEKQTTKYPGVTKFQFVGKDGKNETTFYIRYRQPNSRKVIEEKAGRLSEGMTAARAANLRAERMSGKALTNAQRKDAEQEALKEKAQEHFRATFQELFDLYNQSLPNRTTARNDRGYVKHRLQKIVGKKFEELTTRDFEELIATWRKKYESSTIARTIGLVIRVLNYAVNHGYIERPDPTKLRLKKPREDSEKTEFLTDEQQAKLVNTLESQKSHDGAYYMLLILMTGIRRTAAIKLKWSDIDFQLKTICLRGESAKKGKTAKIRLGEGVESLLKELHGRNQDSPFLFPSPKDRNKPRFSFQRFVDRIKKTAELPKDFRPLHGLRHNFASRLASSGQVDMYTLQRMLTHESPQMTQRYAHLADEAMQRVANLGAIVTTTTGMQKAC